MNKTTSMPGFSGMKVGARVALLIFVLLFVSLIGTVIGQYSAARIEARYLHYLEHDNGKRLAVRNIALAMQEQDQAVHQVTRRIEEIAGMSEVNHAAARSAAETAEDLDRQAASLGQTIGRFKT